ncbi:MAG: 4-hydroxy-tetrahydrodipicolinate synthase [Xanthomonadaceae bacterium]|nr:4-hydroxy-tetrahydrodipicolinate synthase [Xanthomonadaceae bacterium]MDE2083892.1 4-hydroxy-tetrahydrodipicolinate synthase [Xanthomonadaceae bacterium]
MKKLVGSICALATPFRGDALDLAAFGALIDYQLAGGTRALVVAGSTGEAHALSEAEFDRALAFALERVAGRVPVLAGTGTANTRKTIVASRRAQAIGADAALVVTPYYVRPTQEGLFRHFSAIADEAGLPVVLYNVPSRTGCDMLPETAARLAGHERIVGLKEARADGERIAAIVALKRPDFAVLSGDDGTCAQAMLGGADGVISVAANVAPAAMAALCEAALTGNVARARDLDKKLTELYALLGAEPNPIPVKWCLHELGLGLPEPRLPLTGFSPVYHERARQVLGALGLAAVQPRHSGVA